jgi:DinB family protein
MHSDTRITSSADRLLAAAARLRMSLERMNDETAERSRTENGWTPAQVVYHVGLVNAGFFIPAFDGSAPFMMPAPDGFVEPSLERFPGILAAFPQLKPPPVTKRQAIEKLERTTDQLAAVMRRVSPRRLTHCATLTSGTLSIQQVAEFTVGHVERHQAQLDKVLAPV